MPRPLLDELAAFPSRIGLHEACMRAKEELLDECRSGTRGYCTRAIDDVGGTKVTSCHPNVKFVVFTSKNSRNANKMTWSFYSGLVVLLKYPDSRCL